MNNGQIKVLIPSESSQQKKVSFIALRNLHGAQQFWTGFDFDFEKSEHNEKMNREKILMARFIIAVR